ncbi:MAG: hypothetical protein CSA66_07330 [Proteobacteria bacterium]|nr:MAG: hypothetical protein CSA66_07330 [Pseudomonadota bacterium]
MRLLASLTLAAFALGGCLTDRAGDALGDAAARDTRWSDATGRDTARADAATSSCPGGCDDGDPCTFDVCGGDGTCRHDEIDGCGRGCSGLGATPLADLYAGGGGLAWVKTGGRVDMAWPTAACDDGPDCACEGLLGLNDQGVQVVLLTHTDTSEAVTWGCRSMGCVGVVQMTCGDPVFNARYWVWGAPWGGSLGSGGDAPSGAPREAPNATRLLVEDYCLMTTAEALPGRYAVTAELFESVVTTTGEIVGPDGAGRLHLAIDAAACDGCLGGVFPASLAPVTPGDGWMDLQLPLPGSGLDRIWATARLYSSQSTLSGEIAIGSTGGGVGTLWLRRL